MTELDGLSEQELQQEITRAQAELDGKLKEAKSLLEKFSQVRTRAYLTALKLNLSRRTGKPVSEIIARRPTPVFMELELDGYKVSHNEPYPMNTFVIPGSFGVLSPSSVESVKAELEEEVGFSLDINDLIIHHNATGQEAITHGNVISFAEAGARILAKRQEKPRGL